MLSPPQQSKAQRSTLREDSVHFPTKASVSKISSTAANLSSLASRSISYKEVALSPPGTVLKPSLEKAEVEKENVENDICNSPPEISIEEKSCQNSTVEAISQLDEPDETGVVDTQLESSASECEDISLSSDQSKPAETNGSKLSAAAKPFNPGMLSTTHHINSVAVTSLYETNVTEGVLVEPVLPPAIARVPCGPRSPLYYRSNYAFRMKHGLGKCPTAIRDRSGLGAPRIMNPHAPEFVPRRASQIQVSDANSKVSWSETSMEESKKLDEKSVEVKDNSPKKSISESEKSELARQILLSLLVNSVQKNTDSVDESEVSEGKHENVENPSDAIEKDSAIIKILYGNEEKNKKAAQSSTTNEEQKQEDDSNKNIGDEGFTVVTKRKRSKQKFANAVTGLYNQQSICASVR